MVLWFQWQNIMIMKIMISRPGKISEMKNILKSSLLNINCSNYAQVQIFCKEKLHFECICLIRNDKENVIEYLIAKK